MRLADLADRLGCRLEGDGGLEVSRVAGLEAAGPGDLSFLSNPRYAGQLAATRASAVIADDAAAGAPCAVLRSAHPYVTLAEAIAILTPVTHPGAGIHPLSAIDATAEIGPDVSIGAFVSIGLRARIGARSVLYPHVVVGRDVVMGADCVVHAHASIRADVRLGDRVILQDAAVVGSDGFGFAKRADGTHLKIPQVGVVVIEDDVEIGAHSAVDRPAVGETRIGAGTKIDNQVQIAHGVRVGRNALFAAQSGVAGSTVIDDDVTFAGQSGAVGHIHVGRGVVITAKSAVTHDVEAGQMLAGFPAIDIAEWRRTEVLVRKLPELRKQLSDLADRLAALEARLPR